MRTVAAALSILLPLIALADSTPPADRSATPTWNARCRVRFEKARGELARLGRVTVEAQPGEAHLTSYGMVRLTLRRPSGTTLVGEVDANPRRNLYRGYRGIYPKRYGIWHSPYEDSEKRPADGKEPALYLELHKGVPHGTMRGLLQAATTDETAGPFTALLERTIEACLADVRDDEVNPTMVWRRRCAAQLEQARGSLGGGAPPFARGEVSIEQDSVWLKDPLRDQAATFQAMVVCGPYRENTAWRSDGVIEKSLTEKRESNGCQGSVWLYNIAPDVRSHARTTLENALDTCMAGHR